MIIEWFLVIILNGDDFAMIPGDSYTTREDCEVMKAGILYQARKAGDNEAIGYCAAKEVVKKEVI